MGRSPERLAPGTAGGTRGRLAGRSRGNWVCREGPGTVRERGSATAGAAWAGSTHSKPSSGCARVVHYEARETQYSNQVYTLGASLSRYEILLDQARCKKKQTSGGDWEYAEFPDRMSKRKCWIRTHGEAGRPTVERLLKRSFWQSLIAVLAGNAIYFSVERFLPLHPPPAPPCLLQGAAGCRPWPADPKSPISALHGTFPRADPGRRLDRASAFGRAAEHRQLAAVVRPIAPSRRKWDTSESLRDECHCYRRPRQTVIPSVHG